MRWVSVRIRSAGNWRQRDHGLSALMIAEGIPHYRAATNCIRYSNVGVERVGPQGK